MFSVEFGELIHFIAEQRIGAALDGIDPVDFDKEFLRGGLER